MISNSAKAFIEMCLSQVGYHEKATNAYLDDFHKNSGSANWHKFGRDLQKAGFYNSMPKNGHEWCTTFLAHSAWQAFGRDREAAERVLCHLGPYAAGTVEWVKYFKQADRFGSVPQYGACIFFFAGTDEPSHVGAVVAFDDQKVFTVEGNKGNEVRLCTYNRTDPDIYGYGYPLFEDGAFDLLEYPKPDCMDLGSRGAWVQHLQECLTQLGYPVEADGDYGEDTERAVLSFQMANGLAVDGQTGWSTWTAITDKLRVPDPPKPPNDRVAMLQGALGLAADGGWSKALEAKLAENILRDGSSGRLVFMAQWYLMQAGYHLHDGADGNFGSDTVARLKAYQKANGLDPDGEIGPETWKALTNA